MHQMTPLSGQTALVTGASAPRGIGRAIALRLAADGAHVVVADIDGTFTVEAVEHDKIALLQGLVSDIESAGGTARAITLDVTDTQSIDQAITAIGRINILVNNAGSLAGTGNFLSTTPAEWEQSFRVNLQGPMMLAQAVIPGMQKAGGGRIINIGSTGSLGGEAGFGAYTTMKHGMIGLSKTIAAEFGVDGILCNTVCPGYINTDMHAATNNRLAQENGLSVEAMKQQRYAAVAVRRAGEPAEVAAAVAYLASPAAAYVTGISLPVSGGVPFGI